MRHQARLLGDRLHEMGIDLDLIDRREPEPPQLRHVPKDRPHQPAQPRGTRQVEAPGGDIDPGQHDLRITDLDEAARLRHDLAGRIWTGPRHNAYNPPDPQALALWHLPSEKGLSFRRAANALVRERTGRLRADLADARRAAHRFNVDNATATRVRNDAWLATQKLRSAIIERR